MSSKKPHRYLIACQKAMDLAIEIDRIAKSFSNEDLYGLRRKRAGISGPSNIAEGAAGHSRQQFSNYLSNAIASLNEIDTQLELARKPRYLSNADYKPLYQALASVFPLFMDCERR